MNEVFSSIPHGDLLELVTSIAVLLAGARLLGELANRLGQPAIVGELTAGIILGPSVLGALSPVVGGWIAPSSQLQANLLEVISLIGVMLLLVLTGMETDVALIRRRAGTALGVAIGGLVVPFLSGLALGYALPDGLLVDPGRRGLFALFLATAMSISAIPVLAKVLFDLGLIRREIGQTMLAAGMIDDITGWSLLGIVAALAAGTGSLGLSTVAATVGTLLVFVALTITVGRWLVQASVSFVQDRGQGHDRLLTLVVALAFGWGALSHALHLEPVIGAFAIGIILGGVRRLPREVIGKLEGLTLGIFAPIFFAATGLKVDLGLLFRADTIGIALAILLTATFGKVVGAYLGARLLSRQDHWSALSYGSGLNARGAIEIIVASIGLSLGILSPEIFSAIVVMAVITSLMAPFALRYTTARVRPQAHEVIRLRREGALRGGLLSGIRRVLVPVRPRTGTDPAAAVKVGILERLARSDRVAVTVLSSGRGADREAASLTVRQLTHGLRHLPEVSSRVIDSTDPVQAVVAEASRGYDLVVLGATREGTDDETLFGSVVDEIVRMAPSLSLVVSAGEQPQTWNPRRILVPTDGSREALRAADLAFAIADPETVVTVLHIVPRELSHLAAIADTAPAVRLDRAHQLVTEIRRRGDEMDVTTEGMVEMGPEPEQGILSVVEKLRPDLVVLGTSARTGTDRLYLGPRVEYILRSCPAPVAVVNG